MTPYMSYLLQPFCEALQQPSDNLALWQAVLQTLTKTLVHDEKGELTTSSPCLTSPY